VKLIRQTKLHYRSEKSDKIYEVDLCAAGDGEFVVNFRYGRRGTTLREGTKTPFPESRAKAEQIFDDLVASKTKKGYQYTSEQNSLSEVPSSADQTKADAASDDPRVLATLELIEAAARGGQTESSWKLSRAIWTAGAWKVSAAADAIAKLAAESNEKFLLWSSAWAIGRCGAAEHAAALDAIARKPSADASLRRVTKLAKMMVVDAPEREQLAGDELSKMPLSVREAALGEDKAALVAAVIDHVRSGDTSERIGAQIFAVAMVHSWMREAIHDVVCELAPDDQSMSFLRQTFKAAEMVMDAELYGAVVKKFETAPSRGNAKWNWRKQQWGRAPAFSTKTKKYFQRRFVRHLRRAGESGRPELFIPLATGVLLANDDRIQEPEEEFRSEWRWNSQSREYQELRRYAPRYSRHHCFLWLLRSAGQQIHRPGTKSLRWWYAETDERGFAQRREEPFSELWDRAPDAIGHLLRHARSEEVQRFAVRIFRANPAFAQEADNDLVHDLLRSWCDVTTALGLDLAKERWDPANPDATLLLAMLGSRLEEARELGLQWLDAVEHLVGGDVAFLSGLAFLEHPDARERARSFAKTVTLDDEGQKRLVGLVVSALVSMTDPDDESVCAHAADFILLVAGDVLGAIASEHVAALLAHPLEACQQLGVQSLLRRESLEGLSDPMLLAALSSEFGSVRRLGMKLMGRLSDAELRARADLVAGFGISEHAEIRQEAPPLIGRLVKDDAELGRELVERWYPLVLREEEYDGLHAELYALLTGPLSEHLDAIPQGSFRRMLTLIHGHAQLLGFELLQRETTFGAEPLETVVEWGCNDLLALRQAVREHFEENPGRLRDSPGAMMPMLETDWEDTQEWAFDFCRSEVPEEAWQPESLVAICDSVKSRVQSFGREMITRRFQDEHGQLYLQRLSEHPTVDLQIFATNYLTRFAADDVDALESLDHYFRAVLTKIGAGRVAKDRVLAFLEDEATKDVDAARYVEALLRRQVATVSVTDKATCIQILAKLRRQWPELPTKLTRHSVPVHSPEAS
jgi:predicted DNA-binding WGR domain protein